jgi:hypothetical protein
MAGTDHEGCKHKRVLQLAGSDFRGSTFGTAKLKIQGLKRLRQI